MTHPLADQDETLDALAKAISRQRDLSLHISSELEVHEGLLEETDRAVDGCVHFLVSEFCADHSTWVGRLLVCNAHREDWIP